MPRCTLFVRARFSSGWSPWPRPALKGDVLCGGHRDASNSALLGIMELEQAQQFQKQPRSGRRSFSHAGHAKRRGGKNDAPAARPGPGTHSVGLSRHVHREAGHPSRSAPASSTNGSGSAAGSSYRDGMASQQGPANGVTLLRSPRPGQLPSESYATRPDTHVCSRIIESWPISCGMSLRNRASDSVVKMPRPRGYQSEKS